MLGIVWLFRFCADSVVWGIWNKKFLLQFGLPWFVFWLSLLAGRRELNTPFGYCGLGSGLAESCPWMGVLWVVCCLLELELRGMGMRAETFSSGSWRG